MTTIGITGHRELSDHTARLVAAELHEVVGRYADVQLIGVSAIADGADSLFATAVLDAGGSLVVVVPARAYRDSLPPAQQPVYDALLGRAARVIALDRAEPTTAAYMDAALRMLDEIDLLVAVWDGEPARGFGGTAQVVHAAQERHLPVTVVWPAGAAR